MRSDTNEGVSAPDDDLPLVEDEGLAGTGGTGRHITPTLASLLMAATCSLNRARSEETPGG